MKKVLILLTLLVLCLSGCNKDSARAGIIKTGTDYICPRLLLLIGDLRLNNSLCHHSVCNLFKACNVCAGH